MDRHDFCVRSVLRPFLFQETRCSWKLHAASGPVTASTRLSIHTQVNAERRHVAPCAVPCLPARRLGHRHLIDGRPGVRGLYGS